MPNTLSHAEAPLIIESLKVGGMEHWIPENGVKHSGFQPHSHLDQSEAYDVS